MSTSDRTMRNKQLPITCGDFGECSSLVDVAKHFGADPDPAGQLLFADLDEDADGMGWAYVLYWTPQGLRFVKEYVNDWDGLEGQWKPKEIELHAAFDALTLTNKEQKQIVSMVESFSSKGIE